MTKKNIKTAVKREEEKRQLQEDLSFFGQTLRLTKQTRTENSDDAALLLEIRKYCQMKASRAQNLLREMENEDANSNS